MARSRVPFNSTTIGPISGPNYMNNVRDRVKDLWDFSSIQLSAVGGTANAITATCDPPLIAGVTAGMKFSLVAASTNTTGVTLALNGGSTINVRDDNGNALLAGSLTADRLYTLEFDGTNLRVQNSSGVVKINNYQAFTSNGTWTKPAGVPNEALVTVFVWSGGAGGGIGTTNAVSGGGGGGCQVFQCKAGDLSSSVAVTIGAGGAIGGAGGTSSFGSYVTVFGGGPGTQTGSGNNRVASGGGGGGSIQVGDSGNNTSSLTGTACSIAGADGGDITAGTSTQPAVSAGNNATVPSKIGRTGYYGGGAGGSYASGTTVVVENGGKSLFGGGGGAPRTGSAGGASVYGGAGGGPGAAGSAPGGGGGSNAVGARGEVHVYVNG